MINFQEIDKKQQERWEKTGLFKTPQKPRPGKKFYCLDMFPYPSGDGLHVGHPEGYVASDILSRYKRMKGFDVLHPMGWDAFGLPAENYALSTGIHPEEITRKNIKNFTRQIRSLGFGYDWERETDTTDPSYYRWTQWIFLQLFKKGLAYESVVPINWCPSCKTGLANEEVFNGACERCGTGIERRSMRQWLLKITAYAQVLLDDLDELDWPESTLAMQKNWIGRSEGAEVNFKVLDLKTQKESELCLSVFTTRPDTLYGATYMVMSPEHRFVDGLTAPEHKSAVSAYVRSAGKKSDLERTELQKEKTGVFTGSYAVNPLSGNKIPIWIADYILAGYGTGAIMAVPAHDERDWDFAKKFSLPIVRVVEPSTDRPKDGETAAFCGIGKAINSPVIDGLPTAEAKEKIIRYLEEKKIGKGGVVFRLRDWIFSRQRYWGEPIPIVHCDKCGKVPVPEAELPVLLPKVKRYEPTGTGESPLAAIDSWVNTKCPSCSGPAKRETNTMPQWAGSCWYYLRFIDPKNDKAFCSLELEKAWMPVDFYIGGAEHAVLHLLYARFWHKVLYDLGLVSTKEPFQKLLHQGTILSYSYKDSKGAYHPYSAIKFLQEGHAVHKETGERLVPLVEKMSKSKKNVINPDKTVAEYGADAFRMYEMFMGPLEASKPWDINGIEGISRFLKRVWLWATTRIQNTEFSPPSRNIGKPQSVPHPQIYQERAVPGRNGALPNGEGRIQKENKELKVLRHRTIAKVTSDIEEMKFNTAISAMMIYFNAVSRISPPPGEDLETLLTLLHPFAPHITDELWQRLGNAESLLRRPWPVADPSVLAGQEIELGVQINGKLRTRFKVPASMDSKEVEKLALAQEDVRKFMAGKTADRIIVVPKRLVSIVTKG